ncbi:hypothetical protein BUALT_Bualt15G0081600 [Buddleja alternifolia]|uniref:FAE domain-containing protein n=1 Tax=Buddleja alternifolia TaxID=168488 RepID=A0AAV6WDU7_9LAMI|nr:hypothetical protein BUALT_Bualt15G0081600 [Buddleja alternifolia]
MAILSANTFLDDLKNIILSTYFQLTIVISLLLIIYLIFTKTRHIYLVDFSCYLPPAHLRASTANFIEHFEICDVHGREAIDFQTKVAEKSGIGPETSFPLAMHQLPPDKSLNSARDETETILFTVVKDLLAKHSINPKDIDILVSNCSIFCPTPSITAMIVNKFGFRSNVKSVSLGGMGCSAGLVAVSLAKDLLRVHGNSLALVLSMEAVTPSGYAGNLGNKL